MGKTRRQNTQAERTDRNLIKKLKDELKRQKKEITQLKKELDRRTDVSSDYKELLAETEEMNKVNTPNEERCPECSSPVLAREIGKFVLTRCTSCMWRKRK